MDDVKESIRQFILNTYLPGESRDNLRDDTPLLTSGILDSLAALGLAAFVQERFGVELDVYDTSVERFNQIQDIAASVERRQAQGAGQTGGAAR
jgi:acyl carrier protein